MNRSMCISEYDLCETSIQRNRWRSLRKGMELLCIIKIKSINFILTGFLMILILSKKCFKLPAYQPSRMFCRVIMHLCLCMVKQEQVKHLQWEHFRQLREKIKVWFRFRSTISWIISMRQKAKSSGA